MIVLSAAQIITVASGCEDRGSGGGGVESAIVLEDCIFIPFLKRVFGLVIFSTLLIPKTLHQVGFGAIILSWFLTMHERRELSEVRRFPGRDMRT
jgi:hypothetical protein